MCQFLETPIFFLSLWSSKPCFYFTLIEGRRAGQGEGRADDWCDADALTSCKWVSFQTSLFILYHITDIKYCSIATQYTANTSIKIGIVIITASHILSPIPPLSPVTLLSGAIKHFWFIIYPVCVILLYYFILHIIQRFFIVWKVSHI